MRQSTHFPQFIAPSDVAAPAFKSLGSAEFITRTPNGVGLRSGRTHVAERPADPLTWLVFVASGADGSGALFDDAGDGYGFERDDYARSRVQCRNGADIELQFEAQIGGFAARYRTIELDVRGLDRPRQVLVDGQRIDTWDFSAGCLLVRLPASSAARTVNIAGRAKA